MNFQHKPVMLTECIDGLNIKPDGIYVDGTLGGAGHSIEIAKKITTGLLIGIDRDDEALKASSDRLKEFIDKGTVKLVKGNHDDIRNVLANLEITKVDGILLDLGVSSYQLDERSRGFSYMSEDSELDMRMDKTQEFSAKDIVNNYSEDALANILWKYGEEKFSRKIARNIVNNRPIFTTGELVKIIENSIPKALQKNGHPAKKTFQAIRIEVTDEIEPLFNTIEECIDLLNPNGRLCVITFHSLEDRAVKDAMTKSEGICTCPKDFPYCVCGAKKLGKRIPKSAIIATVEELKENSRSKSAKLRIFEKV